MIEPYINLESGKASEAIEFYKLVFNAEVKSLFRLGDMPENPASPLPAEMKSLVGDSELVIQGTILHCADMYSEGKTHDGHVSLMLNLDTEAEVERIYGLLADGGEILMELCTQPFAKAYAWVKDKFGVSWQLMYN